MRHESNHAPAGQAAQPERRKLTGLADARLTLALATKRGVFHGKNAPFASKISAKTAGKGSGARSFFFRETSNFKALSRIFLPTSAVTTKSRGSRRNAPSTSSGQAFEAALGRRRGWILASALRTVSNQIDISGISKEFRDSCSVSGGASEPLSSWPGQARSSAPSAAMTPQTRRRSLPIPDQQLTP